MQVWQTGLKGVSQLPVNIDQEIENLRSRLQVALEYEARFNAFADAFDGYIYICSRDYRIEYLNRHLEDALGYNAIGKFCYNVIHERDGRCPWCPNDRVFAGETVRWEIQSPASKRWFKVTNAPLYHPDGRVSKLSIIFDITDFRKMVAEVQAHRDRLAQLVEARTRDLRDTTRRLEAELEKRKTIENALRKSEEMYRLLVDNASVGIVVTQDGHLMFFNPWVMEATGASEETLVRTPFIHFIHPDDREEVMQHHIRRLAGEEVPKPYILRVIDRNGNTRWIENLGVVIEWNGKPATLNFLKDVTDQTIAQRRVMLLSRELIAAQERERARIARDLHDSTAQELSAVRIAISSMINDEHAIPHSIKSRLSEIAGRIGQAISGLGSLHMICSRLSFPSSGLPGPLKDTVMSFPGPMA